MEEGQLQDSALQQDGAKINHMVEKAADDSIKVLIEAVAAYLQREKKIEIAFETPQDAVTNTKAAIELGATDKQIDGMLDKHGAVQSTAMHYPDSAEGFKDSIVQKAQTELKVDKVRHTNEFKQNIAHRQQQRQALTQSQGNSLGQ